MIRLSFVFSSTLLSRDGTTTSNTYITTLARSLQWIYRLARQLVTLFDSLGSFLKTFLFLLSPRTEWESQQEWHRRTYKSSRYVCTVV